MPLSGGAKETTKLVKELLAFGSSATTSKHLDAESEDISVGGVRAQSQPDLAGGDSSSSKGKGKATEDDSDVSEAVAELSVAPDEVAPSSSARTTKPDNALKRLLRHSTHTLNLPNHETRVLTSWKMADYAYKRDPCPFPTRARGLFTEKVSREGEEEEYRIVARGYDKFFNVGEVSWTQWDTIPKHSQAPYELTLKSNGCIILIAALSPSQILVTSKHATQSQENQEPLPTGGQSHSQVGELWLEKHLVKVGKTKEDLARELYRRNLTAVAELCDDSFEEHVLAYPPELTGLHLHGLNHNTPNLITLPSSEVSAFATAWGLIPTYFITFPSVPAVRTYCQTVEQDGGIDGVPVEGFVVRGKSRDGGSFFWKVKYDQPYLMYREWRELTRKVLSAKSKGEEVKPTKVRNEESRLYLWWVEREIRARPEEFEDWQYGRGIIKTRERHLKWRKTQEARQVARDLKVKMEEDEAKPKGAFDRTLIVPIAIQGCGKTALALALSHLFGWGHTQSDDFIMKKSGPHFIKSVKALLATKDVVIADKNNHIRKLRSDLVDAANSLAGHHTRLIALNWSIDSPTLARDQLHALCAERIVARGANHQTLRAGEGHEGALWQFLGQYEPLDQATGGADGSFDEVIEMDPSWDKRQALSAVVARLVQILDLEVPSEARIEEALAFAAGYKPSVFRELTQAEKDKIAAGQKPRYYGVKISQDLPALLGPIFAKRPSPLYSDLVKNRRIEPAPHVTIVHEAELPSLQPLWDHYVDITTQSKEAMKAGVDSDIGVVDVTLGPRVAFDSRVMTIEVSAMVPRQDGVLKLREGAKAAHVTIGTMRTEIRPVEGKLLLEAVIDGKTETPEGGDITVIEIEPVTVKGFIRGMR